MVGTTVQTMQKVGWIGVTPIEGLEFPYWAGLWLGLFPTWQGLIAQAAALAFVIGSYVAAEGLQRRRRLARIASTASPSDGALDVGLLSQAAAMSVAEREERRPASVT
jgi:high-affinity iron transporter